MNEKGKLDSIVTISSLPDISLQIVSDQAYSRDLKK